MTTLTATTCGAACWYAREPECRCSCGGANHSCLRVEGAEQPRRNCLIKGSRYVLGMVGTYWECEQAMRNFGRAEASKPFHTIYSSGWTCLKTGEAGAPLWRKTATSEQSIKWSELSGTGRTPANPWTSNLSLLWVREDVAEAFDSWLEHRNDLPSGSVYDGERGEDA